MAVKLREKKLSNGQISLYLDIYHNQSRWYEFLDIHINKNRLTQEDKDKKILAQEIRTKREHELIVEVNGLINKKQKFACFVEFIKESLAEKTHNGLYVGVMYNLKLFTGNKSYAISRVNADWLKAFYKFLLGRVSNNTALSYVKIIHALLNEAVRQKIIPRNPYMDIPRYQRLKKQDIFRHSFDIDQLQLLANTECKKVEPQLKQAYFFSCFTGLRWSDLNRLRWDEIKKRNVGGEDGYYIHFEQKKTRAIEYLPLSESAIEIYLQRKAEAEHEEKSSYIFPKIKEDDNNPNKIRYTKYRRQLQNWAKAAGIEPKLLHFHSGRHTFATNLLENSMSADIYTVSKLLGHKSLIATQIYAQVKDNRKKDAVKGLPKLNLNSQNGLIKF